MADGQLSSIVQDKDFIGAPMEKKIAYLSHIDQDFAKAKPDDQQRYIQHIFNSGCHSPHSWGCLSCPQRT